MILDRTWNKYNKRLTVSWIDSNGDRQFFQRYLNYIKTYEYSDTGQYMTWDGKKCTDVYKDAATYKPNDFDILEYLYGLDKETLKNFHSMNFPKLYTFDIETEYSTEFPDPDIAAHKVTAISVVGPDMSCIVFGLNKMPEESIEVFRKRYLDWIDNNEFAKAMCQAKGFKPRVYYQYFSNEEDMLKHFFTRIVPRISCLAGWNAYNFDWNYLTHRLQRLFGQQGMYTILRQSSPTHELGKVRWQTKSDPHPQSAPAPAHSKILDYMEIVKKYDYILRPYESYSLDWVASKAVNAHKIKYTGELQYLYEHDHEWYYYYNAIDSLLVMLIHYKLMAFESPCAVSSVTLVPVMDAFGQVALTTANVFDEFYKEGKKIVYDFDSVERIKTDYEGAFTACNPGRYEYNCCFDFASLYPSQIQTCNLSFENFLQKKEKSNIPGMPDVIKPWTEEELDSFRKDPDYFVTELGHVYKNDKDYTFKIVQRNIKKNRDRYKYTGQRIESELLTEIDMLIKDKSVEKEKSGK